MNEDKIKEALAKAQDAVKDIVDAAIKVKAFELVFNQLSQESETSTVDKLSVTTTSPQVQKSMSIKEFLLKHNAKVETDKTLIFGYFLEKFRHYESFNIVDLRNCYFDAKENIPQNISDKIHMNMSKGFFMQSQQKKAGKRGIILTRTGEEYVETKLLRK